MNDLMLVQGDIAIEDGDLLVGVSDLQNIALLIRLSPGNIKQHPNICYGEERLLNGTLDGAARRDIQEAIRADGYSLTKFEISESQLIIKI